MRLTLPAISRTKLPTSQDAVVEMVKTLLAAKKTGASYVQSDSLHSSRVLLIHKGKIFAAGQAELGRFAPLGVSAFFASLNDGSESQVSVCETDLPLFLCTAVLFRKAPAAQIPTGLVDSASLLNSVRQMGKDAVLVVRRGDARSLVFCHEGEPAALYPAPRERFPSEGSVADRIIEYVYADSSGPPITLDLYDEIKIPPAKDAGRPLESYLQEEGGTGEEPSLVVQLGGRVVFRYPVYLESFTIGRGGDNDLPLDNLSISRNHALVRRKGQNLVFVDQGSENGLRVGTSKVSHAELRPGDDIELGKYTLAYRIFGAGEAQLPAVVPNAGGNAVVEETIAIGDTVLARLLDGKTEHKVRGFVYTLGSGASADFRLSGLGVAKLHARLMRERDGSYRLDHVKGFRSVRVNGKKIKRLVLTPGDTIQIAGTTLQFELCL